MRERWTAGCLSAVATAAEVDGAGDCCASAAVVASGDGAGVAAGGKAPGADEVASGTRPEAIWACRSNSSMSSCFKLGESPGMGIRSA